MVRREFDFFDDELIAREFDELTAKDAAILAVVMDRYQDVGFDDPRPAKVQDYGEGIKCIRHIKGNYKGRALFYVGESISGYQKLWILTVYRKESQEVPQHVLDRAKARRASHEAKLKDEQSRKK